MNDYLTIRVLVRNYQREFNSRPAWMRRLAQWCLGYKACAYLDFLLQEVSALQDGSSGKCICGGEPHVSHCPANPDPFLRGFA